MSEAARPLVLLAAGGTGGHLFPAEALAAELAKRGVASHLATDRRATKYGDAFPSGTVHTIPSETVRGRDVMSIANLAYQMTKGTALSLWMLRQLRPAAVVGFGGYPTLPPVFAATLRRIPTVIHDSNAVIGRANRFLAPRVTAIATAFDDLFAKQPALAAKSTVTGNPVRPAVLEAAAMPYPALGEADPVQILVFGGSQGARVMADVVPYAIERLAPALRARLRLVQQTRPEDRDRVEEVYRRLDVSARLAPFLSDLPAQMGQSHLVIGRAGASTVAELGVVGRPSILVPLPGALDQDQFANAGTLQQAGAALRIPQVEFTPEKLAADLAALLAAPARLATMAEAARGCGVPDAAARLADLVVKVARIAQ